MIRSNSLRRSALGVTSAVFAAIALRAMLAPADMAAELGLQLRGPNGYSEIYAVYLGVWLATAALGVVAMGRVEDALWGDMLAVFVLAQPLARLLAAAQWGWPQGMLFVMLFVEAIGGVALLLVRPRATS
ncbi:DUF4345 family protein [Ramlibacter albus]|uniref:DUF4345 family protein n=1 Tax=Ramlibacter albus TaxID=2079448 RepID=A0A923S3M2_9BURK|nr:DUF4345 family protein [Ramlibacter albus]MBC5765983.1 DUF4345 family protein [Ramlibacter albus]